ncbi:L,D-transpeptidase family protein [Asticcacaulis biprosthecium]|uniref:L,D-transpeptidase family protein n=1 Tax=Asticcacaulis biprosthecium TaxID=76891 RepID=UPI0005910DD9|nr:L,D-transpeptidase family protein [Asticcacaulis biprosthecium]
MVKVFTAVAADTEGGIPSLSLDVHSVPCALGKGGVIAATDKREGDGRSPAGRWPIRYVFYRPDRVAPPQTALKLVPLSPDDGWSDDPAAPDYNTHVKLPYVPSHEKLWRDDHVYDVIVVLGHNDDPPVPGMGSAIFFHLARPDYSGTEGCVAVAISDMLEFLREAQPGDEVEIR